MFEDIIVIVVERWQGWYSKLFEMIPNILVSILIIIISIFIGRLVKAILRNILSKTRMTLTINRLFTNAIYFLIVLLGFFLSLTILNLDKTVASLLAGIGIIGIALGFAFQDLATNYISGIIISFQRPFKRGDQLETNGLFGEVIRIDLRVTKIRTLDGLSVSIPNRMILENTLVNYTETDERRVNLDIGVSYADDLDHVKKVLLKTINGISGINKKENVDILFTEFGDSSINLSVRFWVDNPKQAEFNRARSESIMLIKTAFDKEGITIPFPIRTIDFGIKGGEKLKEHLK